jgi:signal transduction histidine kinase
VNVSLSVSPIKNWRGEIIGASKIARDITDKIEVEKKLQLYIEKLQELNIYKDEFMAMASHELKTPLTVIAVNLQILKLKMQHDPNITFIDKTEEQVNKFNDLINNLLNVSKINAGKLELQKTDFDLNQLIRETISDLDQTTTNHQIIFNHDDTPFMVNADHQKISQVLINIITNGIKYSPRGGNVELNIKNENGNVIVSCSDNGIGIPEKDLENIFARFYRVSGIASSFSGSGIGLYISSEIIKGHGGQIWAESQHGKGSTFYFTLPSLPGKEQPHELK